MLNLVVSAALFGVVLGQFFKVMILFPANVLSILYIVDASPYSNVGPAPIALKTVVLIPGTTVGFVLGQTVFHVSDLLHWLRTRRTPPASRRLSSRQ